MHPAFSVIFLTTLIGVGQGFFTALVLGQVYSLTSPSFATENQFFTVGAIIVLLFLGGGLIASFFHLGHPERAWRAASQWRTSWLSREVITLPLFMFFVFIYAVAQYNSANVSTTLLIGLLGIISSFLLFYCTGMVYACLPFLREWATPLTVVNFILFGCASGFALAGYYASIYQTEFVSVFTQFAIAFTILSCLTRIWVLRRNSALKPKTTTQSAIGVYSKNVKQRSQGQMGGSYNTREFTHGKSIIFIKQIKTIFMVFAFILPLIFLFFGLQSESSFLLLIAFLTQYAGLIAERWHFFAQVNHPQNIYYQTIS